MTVQELYEAGVAILPEQPADNPGLASYILMWTNILLQEALPTENSLRRFERQEELPSAPYVRSLTDEIPYHDSIVRAAFPYGIASFAFIDDDNDYRSNVMRTRYLTALNEASKGTVENIEDVYWGCDEEWREIHL